jgi:hypothetical protein
MKASLAKQVLSGFGPSLPDDWVMTGGSWKRRSGRWVQLFGINPSRWDDTYELSTSLDFLPIPGPENLVVGGIARNTLVSGNGTQRWIRLAEHERDLDGIVAAAAKALKPRVLEPFGDREAEAVLADDRDDWRAPFSLCVIALEGSDVHAAARHYGEFEAIARNRLIPAQHRLLMELMAIGTNHETLVARLDALQDVKLATLKGRPLG